MYQEPYHMTPFLPRDDVPMKELALEVIKVSERLYGGLHPITLRSMMEFLRIINSYYSNLIEGHDTHPVDIERAMLKQYDHDPDKRDLQIESEIHVELEALIDKRLEDRPGPIIFSNLSAGYTDVFANGCRRDSARSEMKKPARLSR